MANDEYEYVEVDFLGKTMTVGALRDALLMLDQSLPVITEGCDCNGEAFSVEVEHGACYIRRAPIVESSEMRERAKARADAIRNMPDVI